MILNPQNKEFKWIFHDFGLRRTFQEWIAPKWQKIDQDNLQIKFSALNVNFSCLGPNLLCSIRPVHVGVKDRYPFEKWWFLRYSLV